MTQHIPYYDVEHLHLIGAGHGAPGKRILTPTRKLILRALHDDTSSNGIAALANIPDGSLDHELLLLLEWGLLYSKDDRFEPTFLIADASESQRVCDHAEKTGKQMGDYLLSQWNVFENLYAQLSIYGQHDFCPLAFFLVGSMILDIGLLAALAKDKSLMPDKPHRPNPEHPDAHYYFWMIEGEWDQLGRSGQRSTSLPWKNWWLVTYGQYKINGSINTHREHFEQLALSAAEEKGLTNAHDLAAWIDVPLFEEEDSKKWIDSVHGYSEQLVVLYHQNEKPIYDLYATLRASRYTPQGFGEFFCWYDHVAYASAVNYLAEAGALKIPEKRYIAVIAHEAMQAAW